MERPIDVLVVDDNVNNLLAFQAVLADLKVNVITVRSGLEALAHLLDHDVAMILLDMHMPGMSGLETATFIRQRKRSRRVPIIFITAYSPDDAEVIRCYSAGAVDFLFKPVVDAVLRAKVAVFVELHRQREELRCNAVLIQAHRLEEARIAWESERFLEQTERARARSQELAERDRRKSEFLAVLGHELRTPLAALAYAVRVMENARPKGEPAGSLQVFDRQLALMVKLVNDILDLSRIAAGKVELERRRLVLREVLEAAFEACRSSLTARAQQLAVELPTEEVSVEGDAARLEQLVANLVDHGSRSTPHGGRVRLCATVDDGAIAIRVGDTVDEPDLGMALVRELVVLQGGAIAAHPGGPGNGMELVVRLPRLKPVRAASSCAG